MAEEQTAAEGRRILRVLLYGFGAVILLLVLALAAGLKNARLIQDSTEALVANQRVNTRLIEELQREQALLNATLYRISRYRLAQKPVREERDRLMAELDEADEAVRKVVADAAGGPRQAMWEELERASGAFSSEGRRLLAEGSVPGSSSRDLFRRHEEVTGAVAKLTAAGYEQALESQGRLERRSRTLVRELAVLLAGGVALAMVCAGVTMRVAARLFRKMAEQAEELNRVTWRMLEAQETTARRFSHELHDELGQSLTAVKANLAALGAAGGVDEGRLADCGRLVDEAIGNVRELSQLLRPTILDDFGLAAGLKWLTERFAERTGIAVKYEGEFGGRVAEETETHLFRIVQEALTNVARHSGATQVAVRLSEEGGKLRLMIRDNGRGLAPEPRLMGLGLRGMAARARSAGGELALRQAPGGGLEIEAWVPRREALG